MSQKTVAQVGHGGGAIQYALNLWPVLLRYCEGGIIESHNLAAESALFGFAIARCNYLFVCADSGGERTAGIYSLIGTAKLNGIDQEAGCAMCRPTSPSIRQPDR